MGLGMGSYMTPRDLSLLHNETSRYPRWGTYQTPIGSNTTPYHRYAIPTHSYHSYGPMGYIEGMGTYHGMYTPYLWIPMVLGTSRGSIWTPAWVPTKQTTYSSCGSRGVYSDTMIWVPPEGGYPPSQELW